MHFKKDKKSTTLSETATSAATANAALPLTAADPSGSDTSAAILKFPGYRVLVAEDNLVNQHVALHMLHKLGCRADVATNGREAIAMHDAHLYDLLLMDCQMPELDGYQATARIRTMEAAGRRTPIIALTGYSSSSEQEKCLAAGMDDFISKPIRPQILEGVLERWLQPPAAQSTLEVGDRNDKLEESLAVFGADFAELAMLYLIDSSKRIVTLHMAGAAGDAVQVTKVAHAFSGSCASIGATRLSALCKEVELHAKAGRLDGFEQKLSAIEAEFDRISAKLQSMVGI